MGWFCVFLSFSDGFLAFSHSLDPYADFCHFSRKGHLEKTRYRQSVVVGCLRGTDALLQRVQAELRPDPYELRPGVFLNPEKGVPVREFLTLLDQTVAVDRIARGVRPVQALQRNA